VGYNDGSKSILYYNAETRKVLNSQNFHFLDPSSTVSPEHLLITPDDAVCEGESMITTMQCNIDIDQTGPSSLQKRLVDDVKENMRHTRRKRVDYRQLHDLFSNEENMHANEITNLLEGNEDQPTLEQARCSLKWPKWEKAIQSELAQLQEKGTWRLVEKPKNVIPISNKWVLMKKHDKEGNVIKYKVRLVARGFT
jgi:hypothetical protein